MVLAHKDALPDTIFRRCLFVTRENQRVLDMAGALKTVDFAMIGRLMELSFEEARDLYEIVSPEMGRMVEAVHLAPGAIGARQAGAGFGGCIVAVAHVAQAPTFVSRVIEAYSASTGLQPAVYPLRPSVGAGPIPLIS
jgi:galactokinase